MAAAVSHSFGGEVLTKKKRHQRQQLANGSQQQQLNSLRRWARAAAALAGRGWSPADALSVAWASSSSSSSLSSSFSVPPAFVLEAAARGGSRPLASPGRWPSLAPPPWEGGNEGGGGSGSEAARDAALFEAALCGAIAAELLLFSSSSGCNLERAARAVLRAGGPAAAALAPMLPSAWLVPLPPSSSGTTIVIEDLDVDEESDNDEGEAAAEGGNGSAPAATAFLLRAAEAARGRCRAAMLLLEERSAASFAPNGDGNASSSSEEERRARARVAALRALSALETLSGAAGAGGELVASAASASLAVAAAGGASSSDPALAAAAARATELLRVSSSSTAPSSPLALRAARARAAAARASLIDDSILRADLASGIERKRRTLLHESAALAAAGRAGGGSSDGNNANNGDASSPAAWLSPALSAVGALEAAVLLQVEAPEAWATEEGGEEEGDEYALGASAAAACSAATALVASSGEESEAALSPSSSSPSPSISLSLASALSRLRAARRQLVRETSQSGGGGTRASWCGEGVAAAWLELEAAAAAVVVIVSTSTSPLDPSLALRVSFAGERLTTSLGLPDARSPPSRLWARGGAPLAPRDRALAEAREALGALAAAAAAGGLLLSTTTAARSHRQNGDGHAASAARAAAALQALRAAGISDRLPLPLAAAAAAAAAALCSDAAFVSALAEGSALVFAAACCAAPGKQTTIKSSSRTIADSVRSRLLEAAVAAAGPAVALAEAAEAAAAAAEEGLGDDASAAAAGPFSLSMPLPRSAAATSGADAADRDRLAIPSVLLGDAACRSLASLSMATRRALVLDATLPLLAAASAALAEARAANKGSRIHLGPSPSALRGACDAVARSGGAAPASLAMALAALADAAGAGGFSSAAAAAMATAAAEEGAAISASAAARRAARAATAEAWLAWHSALVEGAASSEADSAAASWLAGAPDAAAMAERCSRPASSPSVAAASGDRAPVAALELRLAARAARARAAASSPPRREAAASSWEALGSLLGQALSALLPDSGGGSPSQLLPAAALAAVSAGFEAARLCRGHPERGEEERPQQLVSLVEAAAASEEVPPRSRRPLLVAAAALAEAAAPSPPDALSPAGAALRGRAWAALGAARMALACPSGGADPAAAPARAAAAALAEAASVLAPEASERRAAAALPSGPDETPRARAAASAAQVARRAARAAERAAVARPSPPRYSEAREHARGFVLMRQGGRGGARRAVEEEESSGAPGRVLALLSLLSESPRSARAHAEAAAWTSSARAWCSRTASDPTLRAYADVLGPVALGVAEAAAGVALVSAALLSAADAADSGSDARRAAAAAAATRSLAAWPARPCSSAVAAAAASAAAAAAAERVSSSSSEAKAGAAAAAAAAARVRAALHTLGVAAASAKARKSENHDEDSDDPRAVAAQAFACLLGEWESLRREGAADEKDEKKKEKENDEHQRGKDGGDGVEIIFRPPKPRLPEHDEGDEGDELAFWAAFPDHSAAWTDLAGEMLGAGGMKTGGEDLMRDDADAPKPPPTSLASSSSAAADSQSLAALAASLVTPGGPLLNELVAAHAALYGSGSDDDVSEVSASVAVSAPSDLDRFAASFDAAAAMFPLQQQQGSSFSMLPATLDDDEALRAGRLLRLCVEHSRLTSSSGAATSGGAEGSSSSSSPPSSFVDVQAPNPTELARIPAALLPLRTRVAELLAEWPGNPILCRLDAVAARLARLPAPATPLKAAAAGLDLLLASAQLWEETAAASHTRLDAHLGPLSALGARWRALELAGWKQLLGRARSDAAAAGAGVGWFHLYRLVSSAAADAYSTASTRVTPADVAAVAEQFMQSAPLGEYSARRALLRRFAAHAQALALAPPAEGGEEGGNASSSSSSPPLQQQQQLVRVAAALDNVASLYSLYEPLVSAAADRALEPHAKALSDFVKLAKWEDRGYYANRHAAEKAARQLHRLARRSAQALAAPAAGILAGAGMKMGMGDLEVAALAAAESEVVGVKDETKRVMTKKSSSKASSSAPGGWSGESAAAAERKWKASCEASAAIAEGAAAAAAADSSVVAALDPPLPPHLRAAAAAPRLARRLERLLSPTISATARDPHSGAPEQLDSLAAEAASAASALRQDGSASARPRKKKALADFVAALEGVGCSKAASAVPRAERPPSAWFTSPSPVQAARESFFPSESKEYSLLTAADGYFWRSVARVQRLRAAAAAARHDGADISPNEGKAASRLCESALWFVRRVRSSLGVAARDVRRLEALAEAAHGFLLATPSSDSLKKRLNQRQATAALAAARRALARLPQRLADGATLVSAAAETERHPAERGRLRSAAAVLTAAAAALHPAATAVAAAASAAPRVGGGRSAAVVLVVPPSAIEASRKALLAVEGVLDSLRSAAGGGESWRESVPGWGSCERDAAAADMALRDCLESAAPSSSSSSSSADAADAFARISARSDAAVDALLSWAQALAGHGGGGSGAAAAAAAAGAGAGGGAPAARAALSAVVAEAETCLRPRALASAADALGLLLLDAVAVLDGGDEKQGDFVFQHK